MVNRNKAMDIARAMCAIEIIGFWHTLNYMNLEHGIIVKYGAYLTMFCLAVFTFLSGFFLSKYVITNKKDISFFYKKRILRFFPLFLISCISLCIGGEIVGHPWFNSIKQFLCTIIGLGVFYPPMAGTVWYISMLFLFYIITPLILYDKLNKWVVSLVVLALFILIAKIIPIDDRLITYFPFYFLGLCMEKGYINKFNNYILSLNLRNKLYVLLLSLFILFLSVYYANLFKGLSFYIVILIGGAGIIVVSYVISYTSLYISNFLSIIAYSSMAAYLFHRQVYECFRIISPNHIIPYWLMFVAIISMFVLSYYVQKLYDILVNRWFKEL